MRKCFVVIIYIFIASFFKIFAQGDINRQRDNETRLINNLYDVELETGEVISPLIYTKRDWLVRHKLTSLYSNISKEGIKLK
jgi:hypothetical protein